MQLKAIGRPKTSKTVNAKPLPNHYLHFRGSLTKQCLLKATLRFRKDSVNEKTQLFATEMDLLLALSVRLSLF